MEGQTSYVREGELRLANTVVDEKTVDEILIELGSNGVQVEAFKLEKVRAETTDLCDLLRILEKTQPTITSISLNSVDQLDHPQVLHHLANLVQSLPSLQLLDLSSSSISPPLFGIALRAKSSRGPQLNLQFKRSRFSEACADGLLHLRGQEGVELSLVLTNSNVNAHRLTKAYTGTITSSQPQPKSAVFAYSTKESAGVGRHLASECGCGRRMDLFELFFCGECKTVACVFCSRTSVCGFVCYGCGKAWAASRTSSTLCSSCVQCPRCLANVRPRESGLRRVVLRCTFCHWTWEGPDDQIGAQLAAAKQKALENISKIVDSQQTSSDGSSQTLPLSVADAVSNFELSEVNSRLFRTWPLLTHRNGDPFFAFSRLHPLLRHSCRKCSQPFVSYDIGNDKSTVKNFPFLRDVLPVVDIHSLQPPKLRLINFNAGRCTVGIKPQPGCELEAKEIEMEASTAAADLNPLKVSATAVAATPAHLVDLPAGLSQQFSVSVNDHKLFFDFSCLS